MAEVFLVKLSSNSCHCRSAYIGLDNGLVSSGNKPLPGLIIDSDLYRHMAQIGHNELMVIGPGIPFNTS